MKKELLHFGAKLRTKKLHAWQIGVLLSCYNLSLIFAIILLALVSVQSTMWVYLLLLSPVLFTAFWVWFAQQILHFYSHMSTHDAVLTAKIGAFPFLGVFLISVIGLAVAAYLPDVPEWWATMSYYGVLFGGGSIALELTVVVFALRHRISIRRV